VQFVCGCEDIEDDYRFGRPPIDHLDTEIPADLDSKPLQSADSLAEVLAVSQATVLNRLRNSLGKKNFGARWGPHQLTMELQATKLVKYREFLPMLEALQKSNFHKRVSGDESWFYLGTGYSVQWSVCRDEMATKTKPTNDTPAFILTLL
jgi:DNA-binding Lrp family transcriptional regulator